ncbi:MAG TPA: UDP-N-acetylmuramate dehydrogenase [Candidatus Acidoferrales bacterium]|nr:UDP-N-acetylmuramate dehydrogenase [Candidatus Acidoferrales bacterium]
MRIESPRVVAALGELGVEHRPGASLAELTSLGIGGTTDLLRIREHRHLPALVRLLREEGIEHRFLGGGTNVLIADGELPWVMVQLAAGEPDVSIQGNSVRVDAAADLGRMVTTCARQNLGGMEGLIGVPGSVGGALRMNAGAYGTEIGKFVREVEVYRAASGENETLREGQISFEYRHTSFGPGDVMLSARLELPERPYAEIVAGIRVCNEKRRASQPLNQKSAGCIFKNPPGGSAGRMIDGLGLKGLRVGEAMVSERHANFFVNTGHASCADMLGLIAEVRTRVRAAHGAELEEEVIVWNA